MWVRVRRSVRVRVSARTEEGGDGVQSVQGIQGVSRDGHAIDPPTVPR